MRTLIAVVALAAISFAQTQRVNTDCTTNGNQTNCTSTAQGQTPNPKHELGEAIGKLIAAKLRTDAAKKQIKTGEAWCAAHPGHDHGYHFSDGTIVTCDNGVMTPFPPTK